MTRDAGKLVEAAVKRERKAFAAEIRALLRLYDKDVVISMLLDWIKERNRHDLD